MFTVVYAKEVANDLRSMQAYERTQILDSIDEQLTHEPTVETLNEKFL